MMHALKPCAGKLRVWRSRLRTRTRFLRQFRHARSAVSRGRRTDRPVPLDSEFRADTCNPSINIATSDRETPHVFLNFYSRKIGCGAQLEANAGISVSRNLRM